MLHLWFVQLLFVSVVDRVGILGQLFGTPPQLLEHHPIEPWGFWDNFLEHHPNFCDTTPSSRGDSGTNFWNTTPSRILGQLFGAPPQLLEHHPIGDSGTNFWSTTPNFKTPPQILEHHPNFWNTTPSGILGLFGTPPQHHPIGATTRTLTGRGVLQFG